MHKYASATRDETLFHTTLTVSNERKNHSARRGVAKVQIYDATEGFDSQMSSIEKQTSIKFSPERLSRRPHPPELSIAHFYSMIPNIRVSICIADQRLTTTLTGPVALVPILFPNREGRR